MRNLFQSDFAKQKDHLLEKRQGIVEKLQAAEATRDDRTIELALSEDPFAFATIDAEIAGLHSDLAHLDRAVARLDQMEVGRQREKQLAHRRQANNAIAQHIGRADRAAKKFTAAMVNAVAAYDEMLEIAAQVDKLMPPGDETMRKAGLNYMALRDLAFDEVCRLGLPNRDQAVTEGSAHVRAPFPGTHLRHDIIGWKPSLVEPLDAILTKKLKGGLALLTGRTEAKPAAEPVAPIAEPIHPSILAFDPTLRRAEEAAVNG